VAHDGVRCADGRRWTDGYNAQAVATAEQIVIAGEISTESLDAANLHPMLTAAEEAPRRGR
jgi:hypothetical protein